MDFPVWVPAAGLWSSIGALVTATFIFLLRSKKQANSHEVSLVTLLTDRVQRVEGDHRKCTQEVAELRERVGRLQATVERVEGTVDIATAVAHILADSRGTILEANEGARLLFEWLPADLVGKSVDVLVPYRSRQQHDQAFHKAVMAIDDTPPRNIRDVFAYTKSGREIPVTVEVQAVQHAGKRAFTAKIMRKVT